MQNSSERIESESLKRELAQDARFLIVDVRTPAEFESEHIAGAVNVPLAELPDKLPPDSKDQVMVLVCRTDRRATAAAELLAAKGFAPKVLVGGVTAWRNKNFPVVEGKKSLPLDQQVQLIAGSLILAGTLMGIFAQKTWLVLPIFVGAGLTYAGLSGNCGLAMALSHAPWNRKSEPTGSCSRAS